MSEYRFDGDLLIAPGHGSLKDGFMEFYPLTHIRKLVWLQWISQGYVGAEYDAVWPPEDDPGNWTGGETTGKLFEIWHHVQENRSIVYDQYPYTVERFLSGTVFSWGAFRRYRTPEESNIDSGQAINATGLIFWDLSKLPSSVRISKAEVVGYAFGPDDVPDVRWAWVTSTDSSPDGEPGWFGDYKLRSPGSALAVPASAFGSDRNDKYPNPKRGTKGLVSDDLEDFQPSNAYPLKGLQRIRRNQIGLRFGFAHGDIPPDGSNFSIGLTTDYDGWKQWWSTYATSNDPADAESGLGELPCLRVYFAPQEVDEPTRNHDARQVRAEHSEARRQGRTRR